MANRSSHKTHRKRYRNENHSAEKIVAKKKNKRLAELTFHACKWIARGRKANRTLGKIFNKLKALVGHGKWQHYFKKHFEPRGIDIRTAARYMSMARETRVLKNDNLANLAPANDPQARAIRKATQDHQLKVAKANAQLPQIRAPRIRPNGIFKVPMRMKGNDMNATEAIIYSQQWRKVEKQLIATLRKYFAEFGLLENSQDGHSAQAAAKHSAISPRRFSR